MVSAPRFVRQTADKQTTSVRRKNSDTRGEVTRGRGRGEQRGTRPQNVARNQWRCKRTRRRWSCRSAPPPSRPVPFAERLRVPCARVTRAARTIDPGRKRARTTHSRPGTVVNGWRETQRERRCSGAAACIKCNVYGAKGKIPLRKRREIRRRRWQSEKGTRREKRREREKTTGRARDGRDGARGRARARANGWAGRKPAARATVTGSKFMVRTPQLPGYIPARGPSVRCAACVCAAHRRVMWHKKKKNTQHNERVTVLPAAFEWISNEKNRLPECRG